MEELKQDLMKRNYPILLINDGIEKAMEKDIKELRQVKEKLNQNQIMEITFKYEQYVLNENDYLLPCCSDKT